MAGETISSNGRSSPCYMHRPDVGKASEAYGLVVRKEQSVVHQLGRVGFCCEARAG